MGVVFISTTDKRKEPFIQRNLLTRVQRAARRRVYDCKKGNRRIFRSGELGPKLAGNRRLGGCVNPRNHNGPENGNSAQVSLALETLSNGF